MRRCILECAMSKGSYDSGLVFHAGFPNAAEDEKFGSLSLDELAVRHRSSTFFWRLENDVPELLWAKESVLVVDRSLEPKEGSVIVAASDDDFLLLRRHGEKLYRLNGVSVEGEVAVWGVVTYCMQKV